ncbi:MAG: PspC domain-containing protein [Sphingobium sp.]|nr:PspC domain-containing protein [Sphingobium sp.]
MQFTRNSLSLRSDTMFGVCEALGQDFGVSANWFRVAFAFAVIYNLEYAVLAYAAVGALVLLSRLIYPSRAVAEAEPAHDAVETAAPVAAEAPLLAEAA